LVEHREHVAQTKRKAYQGETYWGRPLLGFGDLDAELVIVGLAPGAHGANRTGRVFTGDRSGEFLYRALHRAGLSSQSTSLSRDDGLVLRGAFITLPVRCVPPDNLPTKAELEACSSFLLRETALLHRARVFLALGAIAWRSVHRLLEVPHMAKFAHGAVVKVDNHRIVGSYHVSQQNTQTGRLSAKRFDAVLARAMKLTRS
jgi:uracil-DNA glycosylase family 4